MADCFPVYLLRGRAHQQAHVFLEQIKETAAARTPLSIVLNRHRRSWWRAGLKLREVERALGRKVEVCVPSDYRLFSGAADHGLPIGKYHSGSAAERQIGKMMLNAIGGSGSKGRAA